MILGIFTFLSSSEAAAKLRAACLVVEMNPWVDTIRLEIILEDLCSILADNLMLAGRLWGPNRTRNKRGRAVGVKNEFLRKFSS